VDCDGVCDGVIDEVVYDILVFVIDGVVVGVTIIVGTLNTEKDWLVGVVITFEGVVFALLIVSPTPLLILDTVLDTLGAARMATAPKISPGFSYGSTSVVPQSSTLPATFDFAAAPPIIAPPAPAVKPPKTAP